MYEGYPYKSTGDESDELESNFGVVEVASLDNVAPPAPENKPLPVLPNTGARPKMPHLIQTINSINEDADCKREIMDIMREQTKIS